MLSIITVGSFIEGNVCVILQRQKSFNSLFLCTNIFPHIRLDSSCQFGATVGAPAGYSFPQCGLLKHVSDHLSRVYVSSVASRYLATILLR